MSAPNCWVSLIGISNGKMRPVTLSSAANTAMGFSIFSAHAGDAASALKRASGRESRARLRRLDPASVFGL
ncbi:MAG: hypothetical protein WBE04_03615, partial [Methyloceanibacter sp.]